MNLYLRLLLVWLRNIAGARRHYLHISECSFRVLPHDLDAFGHMNNGRYLQIMDVARAEWMLQTGVAKAIRQYRWSPILGGGFIRYRHSLTLLQKYHVRTRLIGWDQRWFYLEHCFIDARKRCVAAGVTRAGLRNSRNWVHANIAANVVRPGARSPAVPQHIRDWLDLEDTMFRHSIGQQQVDTTAPDFRCAS